ncbi:MAG: mannose-1-phosphate guanylyltransferase/mannose-6-phosphate isomerase, partial [Proteobacteria bacterium]
MSRVIPVILSGGGGTRLWPISRQSYPKQFCDLLDESLFNKTALRIAPLGEPWVVTVQKLKSLTDKSMKDLGYNSANVIYEPFGKNTAAAIALVCHYFQMNGKVGEVVGIFPADHLIDDDQKFRSLVQIAAKYAEAGDIVEVL